MGLVKLPINCRFSLIILLKEHYDLIMCKLRPTLPATSQTIHKRSVHFNNGGPAQRFHALPLILPPHFLRGAEAEVEVSCGPLTPRVY